MNRYLCLKQEIINILIILVLFSLLDSLLIPIQDGSSGLKNCHSLHAYCLLPLPLCVCVCVCAHA